MTVEHAASGLTRARAQIEHASHGVEIAARGSSFVLQPLVIRYLLRHELEVGVRVEVELAHVPVVPRAVRRRIVI